jgi:hypothetical protein
MAKDIIKGLEKLLIPVGQGWEITDVFIDNKKEAVEVVVSFTDAVYRVGKKKYPVYDYRPERRWRHLDLWQYKTYISSRIPRINTETGVESIAVPWANSHERMSTLLEKK